MKRILRRTAFAVLVKSGVGLVMSVPDRPKIDLGICSPEQPRHPGRAKATP
jgi:hypothetical protein